MEDINYLIINKKCDRHQELKQRIADLEYLLSHIKGGKIEMPEPGCLTGSSGRIGTPSGIARLTVPMINSVEEFEVPIVECIGMLTALLDELKEEFEPLDKKVQRWFKEAL